MNTKHLISLIALTGSLSLFSSTTDAQFGRVIDCDKGQSLHEAIKYGVGQLDLIISGTCNEDIVIGRDDVLIETSENDENNAVINGTVTVDDSKRVVFGRITLTGPGPGVIIGAQSSVRFYDTTIDNNVGPGVQAGQGSWVVIVGATISNNSGGGVSIGQGTKFSSVNANIINNAGNGVSAHNNSLLDIHSDSTISSNTGNGLSLSLHSSAYIQDSLISSNSHSGIYMDQDSGASTNSNLTIDSNGGAAVYCSDTESSFSSNSQLISGNVSCTDFNQ